MPTKGFAAQADAWVLMVKARERAVFQEATQRVVEIMQTPVGAGGRMRVDTGFLRASLRATLGDPGFAVTYKPDGTTQVSYNETAVALVIANAQIGDKISVIYTANYAIPREYGANGQTPDAFVRTAAQQWPQIVAQVATEAKSRKGA